MNDINRVHFIIVGAQKAGTSTLFHTLNTHSNITGSLRKEIHFFDDDEAYLAGEDYYHRFFRADTKIVKSLFFEATPAYLYHPEAAQRIYKYNKNAKIIISLRDPVLRALSGWNMYHSSFKNHPTYFNEYDSRSFSQAIETEIRNIESTNFLNNKKSYVKRGIYYPQVKEYFNYFPIENLLIIDFNDLKLNHDDNVKKICKFLEIPYENLIKKTVNRGPNLDLTEFQEEVELLRRFYQIHNEMLFNYLGKTFTWL